jgi:Sigma-54 interaction domain
LFAAHAAAEAICAKNIRIMCKTLVRRAGMSQPNWLNHTCHALEYELPLEVSLTLMAYVLGSHDPIKDHERRIGFIARSGLPLLIEGECGTGKEALAELVHELNGASGQFGRILCRQTGPVVNLAAGNGNGAVDLSQTYASARGTIFLKNVQVLLGAMHLARGRRENQSAVTRQNVCDGSLLASEPG